MLETIEDLYNKHAVFASNFNYFSGTYLHSYGWKTEKQLLKKNLLQNLLNLKKSLICITFVELETIKLKDLLFFRSPFLF